MFESHACHLSMKKRDAHGKLIKDGAVVTWLGLRTSTCMEVYIPIMCMRKRN